MFASNLFVFASTRDEAIDKMSSALEEFTVEGIHTTIPFHRKVMKGEAFRSSDYDTSFIGEKACALTAQAFPPAVQTLIGKLVHHPDFAGLLK